MKLNRHNYEEYFILYLDNELGSEDCREVEIFAQANPDLKAELDILLQSRLTPDADIIFDNKELLMIRNSSSISMINYEEWLVTYIDNELTEEERKDVEQFVAANPVVQKELDLLQQIKLQPEAINFPHKDLLYRREEKARVVYIRWWRIAAAAVLLLGISTTAIILLNKKTGEGKIDIAKEQPQLKISADSINNIKLHENIPPVDEVAMAKQGSKKIDPPIKKDKNVGTKEKIKQPLQEQKDEPMIADNTKEKKKTNDLPQPVENPYVTKQIESNNTIAAIPSKEPLTIPKEDIISASVTDDVPQPSYAIERSGGNKGLRGFFRKVTRTIEKRTNIKATDDDDRLLIAGLAIKMN